MTLLDDRRSELWKEYLCPASVKEALDILKSYKGQARIVAGGTDLVIELQEQARQVKCLVDVSGIAGLNTIELIGDGIKIGASVTHQQAASSQLVRDNAPLLAEAALSVGSPQIRNKGTIVGNIVSAQPAADAALALFALDAEVEITGINGKRLVPIGEMYRDTGLSGVDSASEIVTAIRFKCLKKNQGSAFVRLAQRKALALPVLNVAVVVTVQDGRFKEARIAVAPVALVPFRSRKAEAALSGTPVGMDSINAAADLAMSEAQPRDSALRGSAEYRKNMVRVLVRRALEQAASRIAR